jgi:hypothetical protein
MGVKFIGSGGQSSIFEELFSFFWGTLLEKETAASPGCSSYTSVLLTKIAPGCPGVYEIEAIEIVKPLRPAGGAVAFSGRKTIRTGHPQGDTLFEL